MSTPDPRPGRFETVLVNLEAITEVVIRDGWASREDTSPDRQQEWVDVYGFTRAEAADAAGQPGDAR